jgi:hypothetical protein
MENQHRKPTAPPPFSSESARRAQRLSVVARRVTDKRLRAELAARLPAMPRRLLLEVADLLPIRQVELLSLRAMGR